MPRPSDRLFVAAGFVTLTDNEVRRRGLAKAVASCAAWPNAHGPLLAAAKAHLASPSAETLSALDRAWHAESSQRDAAAERADPAARDWRDRADTGIDS